MAATAPDLNALVVDFTIFASTLEEPSASELRTLVVTLLQAAASSRSERSAAAIEIVELKEENSALKEKLDFFGLSLSAGSSSLTSESGTTDEREQGIQLTSAQMKQDDDDLISHSTPPMTPRPMSPVPSSTNTQSKPNVGLHRAPPPQDTGRTNATCGSCHHYKLNGCDGEAWCNNCSNTGHPFCVYHPCEYGDRCKFKVCWKLHPAQWDDEAEGQSRYVKGVNHFQAPVRRR